MSPKVKRLLAWLPMLSVIPVAVRTAAVWDRLPQTMASHFDFQGNPNGWMSKTGFTVLMFVILVPVIALLAVIADRISRRRPLAGWGMIALTWATALLMVFVFWATIDANLYHTRLAVSPVWVLTIALVPISLAIGIDWRWWFSPQRRQAARKDSRAQVIAEEQHGSLGFAVAFFAGALLLVILSLPGRDEPWRVIILLAGAVVLVLSGLWALRGFTYRFTTTAIEVRILGFRLRTIPLSQVTDYEVVKVNPLMDFGGWGIKGFGNETAYIWGGRSALRIRTRSGDIYLGHRDPQRLANHLDRVMQYAH